MQRRAFFILNKKPDQAANLARKLNHARSDAMLLAFYGSKAGVLVRKTQQQKALAEKRIELRLWKKWRRERIEGVLDGPLQSLNAGLVCLL